MKYSIITPTYNRADCISRCIESVIRNLSPELNFEHIIVDDGSTDDTSQIVESYAQENAHIKFIKFKQNRGTNAARNAAIKSATGDFCILLDSDDYFVDNAIKIINDVVENNSEYKYFMFAPDDKVEEYKLIPLLNKNQTIISFKDVIINNLFTDFIHVIDSNIIKKYPFDEYLRTYEGVFFLRFYQEAQKMYFSNVIVTIRERKRNDSVSKDFFQINRNVIRKNIASLSLTLEWFNDAYIKYAPVKLESLYLEMFDNLLRLSDYKRAKFFLKEMQNFKFYVPTRYKIIYILRLGYLYFLLKKNYLYLKYYILKCKFN